MRYFALPKKQHAVDDENYVIVHIWPQRDRNSAGHASLAIVCNGTPYHVSCTTLFARLCVK